MSYESFDFEANLGAELSAHYGRTVPVVMIGEPVQVAGNAIAVALSYVDDKGSWVEGNIRIEHPHRRGLSPQQFEGIVLTYRWPLEHVIDNGEGNLALGAVERLHWLVERERIARPALFAEKI